MESLENSKKDASLGVKFLTEHGLASSVLAHLDIIEQIRLQLAYNRTYHVITQQNMSLLQKAKQHPQRRHFL